MRIAVLSANLGSYDPPRAWPRLIAQDWQTIDVFQLTDETLPPRPLAMTSRLQAGMLKMFGWQLYPGYDRYVWIDASCIPASPHAIDWFLEALGAAELAVFRHPDRGTIRAEYQFLKDRLARPGETYLTSRYGGEWLDAQYGAIAADPEYYDDQLFASTAFVYRPTPDVCDALKEWWYHKTRYLLHDQLALPYVLGTRRIDVRVIEDNYLDCGGIRYVRNARK